jgi:O-antigen/teichoic acid export membrane protein
MKISKKQIIWNYLGTIFNQGMNIFLLPLILRILSPEELGLWYVFGSIAALVNLVDFGFSPTIMRNISYAFAGADKLLANGVSLETLGGEPNYNLLKALINSSRKLYLGLSIISGVVLVSIGTIYVKSITGSSFNDFIHAWMIYALAVFINLYYSYWNPVLKGAGGIKEINQALVISRILYFCIASVTLIMGYGLQGLSVAYLISGLAMRILAKHYFNKLTSGGIKSIITSIRTKEILKIIWPNAKKSGIVTIGSWLITRSTTLLCSSFLGLEQTARFGLSLQVITFVITFSTLLYNSYIPELAYLEVHRDTHRYNLILSRGIVIQWTIGIVGLAGVVICGNWALGLLKSNSTLLSTNILLLLSIVLFLEHNHSTFATTITLSNYVPFVKASLLSGFSIVTLGYLVLRYTTLGLLGLIIVQGLVQLSYNNWYWPYLVLKKNHLSPINMFKLAFEKKQSR